MNAGVMPDDREAQNIGQNLLTQPTPVQGPQAEQDVVFTWGSCD